MSRLSLLVLSFAMVIAIPAMALADTLYVSNILVTNTDTSKASGDTGTASVWLTESNGDPAGDRNGCNAATGDAATVTLGSTNSSISFPNGNSAQLVGCGSNNGKQIAYKVADNAQPGQAIIKGTVTGGKSNSLYNVNDALTVTITAPAKQNTSVSLDPASGAYGGNATLKATLKTAAGVALSGKTVDFKLNGTAAGSATTDTSGVATKSVSLSGIDAGTHTHYVAANFAGDAANNGSAASGDLTIDKAQATIDLGGMTKTYDGSPQGAAVATSPAGLGGVSVTYDGGAQAPTDAGSYAVVATLDNPNYRAQDATGTLVIEKATPQITWGAPNDIVYGTRLGDAQLNASSDVAGSFSYTPASGAKLDAGDGQDLRADFTPANPGNYNTASKTVKIDVNKADQSITFGALAGKTYGDADFAVGASSDSGLDVSLSSATPAKCSVTNGSARILQAGACTIVASQDGNANYNAATSVSRSFEIAKKALKVTANDETKTYGDPNPNFTGTLTGVENGDEVNVSYSTAADAASEVGTYAIVPAIDASEAVLANYELPVLTNGKLTVGKAPLTIKADDATRKYDAADPAFTGSIVSGAIKNNDAVGLAFNTQASRTSNVGTYAIAPSLSGQRASNYDVTAQNGALTITKARATISLGGLSQVYDGTVKAAAVTTSPDSPNKQLTVTYDGSAQAPTNAGSYRVVASLNDANYEAEDATGTLVIDKAQATIDLGGMTKTYNGSPQGAAVTTSPAGLGGVSVTYDGGAQAPTDAGSYAVVATLDNPNYRAQDATGTLVIEKAVAEVSLGGLSQVYDGTVKAAKATTNPAGLKVDLSYEQGDSPATPRDAGNYTVVATINDANYEGSATGTLNIAKASQTINFGALGPKTLGDPDFGVSATGGGSGNPVTFAAAGGCTISGSTVRITAIGACEITASQVGNGNYGDASPVRQSFRINYRFAGYRAPVDNGGVYNIAKAGSSIPMKFSLFGNQGLNIIEAGYPKATAVNCTSSASTDAIEETTTANSGLTYDATVDQYNYVWKTPGTYAGKCYKFDMVLKDGTSHTALFKFTR